MKICSVPSCEKKMYARGLCLNHYNVNLRRGVYAKENIRIPVKDEFMSRYCPEPFSGCFLWEGSCTRQGYGQLRVNNRLIAAHRLSYELNVGHIPSDMMVLHCCDTPPCINPTHLFLGKSIDNVHDMIQKGRNPNRKGVNAGRAILNESQVREIRMLDKNRGATSRRELAETLSAQYGMTAAGIRGLLYGSNWGCVT